MDLSTVEGGLLELPFQCGICGKDFVCDDLENHMKSHSEEEEQQFDASKVAAEIEGGGETRAHDSIETVHKVSVEVEKVATKKEQHLKPVKLAQEKLKVYDTDGKETNQTMCGNVDIFDSLMSLDVVKSGKESHTTRNPADSSTSVSKSKDKVGKEKKARGKGKGKRNSADSNKIKCLDNSEQRINDIRDTVTDSCKQCLSTWEDKVDNGKGSKQSVNSGNVIPDLNSEIHRKDSVVAVNKADMTEPPDGSSKTKSKAGRHKKSTLNSEKRPKQIIVHEKPESKGESQQQAHIDTSNSTHECVYTPESEKGVEKLKGKGKQKPRTQETTISPHKRKIPQPTNKTKTVKNNKIMETEVPIDKKHNVELERKVGSPSRQRKKNSKSHAQTNTAKSNVEIGAVSGANKPQESYDELSGKKGNLVFETEETGSSKPQPEENTNTFLNTDCVKSDLKERIELESRNIIMQSNALKDTKRQTPKSIKDKRKTTSENIKTIPRSHRKTTIFNSQDIENKNIIETDNPVALPEVLAVEKSTDSSTSEVHTKASSRHRNKNPRQKTRTDSSVANITSNETSEYSKDTAQLEERAGTVQSVISEKDTSNSLPLSQNLQSQSKTNSFINVEEVTQVETDKPKETPEDTTSKSRGIGISTSPLQEKKSRTKAKVDTSASNKTQTSALETDRFTELLEYSEDKHAESANRAESLPPSPHKRRKSPLSPHKRRKSPSKAPIISANSSQNENSRHAVAEEEKDISLDSTNNLQVQAKSDLSFKSPEEIVFRETEKHEQFLEVSSGKQTSLKPLRKKQKSPQRKKSVQSQAKMDKVKNCSKDMVACESGKPVYLSETLSDVSPCLSVSKEKEITEHYHKDSQLLDTRDAISNPEDKAKADADEHAIPAEECKDEHISEKSINKGKKKHTISKEMETSKSKLEPDSSNSFHGEDPLSDTDKHLKIIDLTDKEKQVLSTQEQENEELVSIRKWKSRSKAETGISLGPLEENVPVETDKYVASLESFDIQTNKTTVTLAIDEESRNKPGPKKKQSTRKHEKESLKSNFEAKMLSKLEKYVENSTRREEKQDNATDVLCVSEDLREIAKSENCLVSLNNENQIKGSSKRTDNELLKLFGVHACIVKLHQISKNTDRRCISKGMKEVTDKDMEEITDRSIKETTDEQTDIGNKETTYEIIEETSKKAVEETTDQIIEEKTDKGLEETTDTDEVHCSGSKEMLILQVEKSCKNKQTGNKRSKSHKRTKSNEVPKYNTKTNNETESSTIQDKQTTESIEIVSESEGPESKSATDDNLAIKTTKIGMAECMGTRRKGKGQNDRNPRIRRRNKSSEISVELNGDSSMTSHGKTNTHETEGYAETVDTNEFSHTKGLEESTDKKKIGSEETTNTITEETTQKTVKEATDHSDSSDIFTPQVGKSCKNKQAGNKRSKSNKRNKSKEVPEQSTRTNYEKESCTLDEKQTEESIDITSENEGPESLIGDSQAKTDHGKLEGKETKGKGKGQNNRKSRNRSRNKSSENLAKINADSSMSPHEKTNTHETEAYAETVNTIDLTHTEDLEVTTIKIIEESKKIGNEETNDTISKETNKKAMEETTDYSDSTEILSSQLGKSYKNKQAGNKRSKCNKRSKTTEVPKHNTRTNYETESGTMEEKQTGESIEKVSESEGPESAIDDSQAKRMPDIGMSEDMEKKRKGKGQGKRKSKKRSQNKSSENRVEVNVDSSMASHERTNTHETEAYAETVNTVDLTHNDEFEAAIKAIDCIENPLDSVGFEIGTKVKDPIEIPQDEIEQTLFALGLGTSLPSPSSDPKNESSKGNIRSKSPQAGASEGSNRKKRASKSRTDQSILDGLEHQIPKTRLRNLSKIGKQSWLKHMFDLDSDSDDDWEIELPLDERLAAAYALNTHTDMSVFGPFSPSHTSTNTCPEVTSSTTDIDRWKDTELMQEYGLSTVSVVLKRIPISETEVINTVNYYSAHDDNDQIRKTANVDTEDTIRPKSKGRPHKTEKDNVERVIDLHNSDKEDSDYESQNQSNHQTKSNDKEDSITDNKHEEIINQRESEPSMASNTHDVETGINTNNIKGYKKRGRGKKNANRKTSHSPAKGQDICSMSQKGNKELSDETITERQADKTVTEKQADKTVTEKQADKTVIEKQAYDTETKKQANDTVSEKQADETVTEMQKVNDVETYSRTHVAPIVNSEGQTCMPSNVHDIQPAIINTNRPRQHRKGRRKKIVKNTSDSSKFSDSKADNVNPSLDNIQSEEEGLISCSRTDELQQNHASDTETLSNIIQNPNIVQKESSMRDDNDTSSKTTEEHKMNGLSEQVEIKRRTRQKTLCTEVEEKDFDLPIKALQETALKKDENKAEHINQEISETSIVSNASSTEERFKQTEVSFEGRMRGRKPKRCVGVRKSISQATEIDTSILITEDQITDSSFITDNENIDNQGDIDTAVGSGKENNESSERRRKSPCKMIQNESKRRKTYQSHDEVYLENDNVTVENTQGKRNDTLPENQDSSDNVSFSEVPLKVVEVDDEKQILDTDQTRQLTLCETSDISESVTHLKVTEGKVCEKVIKKLGLKRRRKKKHVRKVMKKTTTETSKSAEAAIDISSQTKIVKENNQYNNDNEIECNPNIMDENSSILEKSNQEHSRPCEPDVSEECGLDATEVVSVSCTSFNPENIITDSTTPNKCVPKQFPISEDPPELELAPIPDKKTSKGKRGRKRGMKGGHVQKKPCVPQSREPECVVMETLHEKTKIIKELNVIPMEDPSSNNIDVTEREMDSVRVPAVSNKTPCKTETRHYDSSKTTQGKAVIDKMHVVEDMSVIKKVVSETLPAADAEDLPIIKGVVSDNLPVAEDMPVIKGVVSEKLPAVEDKPVIKGVVSEILPGVEDIPVIKGVVSEKLPVVEDMSVIRRVSPAMKKIHKGRRGRKKRKKGPVQKNTCVPPSEDSNIVIETHLEEMEESCVKEATPPVEPISDKCSEDVSNDTNGKKSVSEVDNTDSNTVCVQSTLDFSGPSQIVSIQPEVKQSLDKGNVTNKDEQTLESLVGTSLVKRSIGKDEKQKTDMCDSGDLVSTPPSETEQETGKIRKSRKGRKAKKKGPAQRDKTCVPQSEDRNVIMETHSEKIDENCVKEATPLVETMSDNCSKDLSNDTNGKKSVSEKGNTDSNTVSLQSTSDFSGQSEIVSIQPEVKQSLDEENVTNKDKQILESSAETSPVRRSTDKDEKLTTDTCDSGDLVSTPQSEKEQETGKIRKSRKGRYTKKKGSAQKKRSVPQSEDRNVVMETHPEKMDKHCEKDGTPIAERLSDKSSSEVSSEANGKKSVSEIGDTDSNTVFVQSISEFSGPFEIVSIQREVKQSLDEENVTNKGEQILESSEKTSPGKISTDKDEKQTTDTCDNGDLVSTPQSEKEQETGKVRKSQRGRKTKSKSVNKKRYETKISARISGTECTNAEKELAILQDMLNEPIENKTCEVDKTLNDTNISHAVSGPTNSVTDADDDVDGSCQVFNKSEKEVSKVAELPTGNVMPMSQEQADNDTLVVSSCPGECAADSPSNSCSISGNDVIAEPFNSYNSEVMQKNGKRSVSRRGRRKGSKLKRGSDIERKIQVLDGIIQENIDVLENTDASAVVSDKAIGKDGESKKTSTNIIPAEEVQSSSATSFKKEKNAKEGNSKRVEDICLSHEKPVEILVDNSDSLSFRNISECFHVRQQCSDESTTKSVRTLFGRANKITVQNKRAENGGVDENIKQTKTRSSRKTDIDNANAQDDITEATPTEEPSPKRRQRGQQNVSYNDGQNGIVSQQTGKVTVNAVIHREDSPCDYMTNSSNNITDEMTIRPTETLHDFQQRNLNNVNQNLGSLKESNNKQAETIANVASQNISTQNHNQDQSLSTGSCDSVQMQRERTTCNSEMSSKSSWPNDIVLAFTPLEENLREKRYRKKGKRKLSKEKLVSQSDDSSSGNVCLRESEENKNSGSKVPCTEAIETAYTTSASEKEKVTAPVANLKQITETQLHVAEINGVSAGINFSEPSEDQNNNSSAQINQTVSDQTNESGACKQKLLLTKRGRFGWKASRVESSDMSHDGPGTASEDSLIEEKRLCEMSENDAPNAVHEIVDTLEKDSSAASLDLSLEQDGYLIPNKKARKHDGDGDNNQSDEAVYTVEADTSRTNVIIMRRKSEKLHTDNVENFESLQTKMNNRGSDSYTADDDINSEYNAMSSLSLEDGNEKPYVATLLEESVPAHGISGNYSHTKRRRRRKGRPSKSNYKKATLRIINPELLDSIDLDTVCKDGAVNEVDKQTTTETSHSYSGNCENNESQRNILEKRDCVGEENNATDTGSKEDGEAKEFEKSLRIHDNSNKPLEDALKKELPPQLSLTDTYRRNLFQDVFSTFAGVNNGDLAPRCSKRSELDKNDSRTKDINTCETDERCPGMVGDLGHRTDSMILNKREENDQQKKDTLCEEIIEQNLINKTGNRKLKRKRGRPKQNFKIKKGKSSENETCSSGLNQGTLDDTCNVIETGDVIGSSKGSDTVFFTETACVMENNTDSHSNAEIKMTLDRLDDLLNKTAGSDEQKNSECEVVEAFSNEGDKLNVAANSSEDRVVNLSNEEDLTTVNSDHFDDLGQSNIVQDNMEQCVKARPRRGRGRPKSRKSPKKIAGKPFPDRSETLGNSVRCSGFTAVPNAEDIVDNEVLSSVLEVRVKGISKSSDDVKIDDSNVEQAWSCGNNVDTPCSPDSHEELCSSESQKTEDVHVHCPKEIEHGVEDLEHSVCKQSKPCTSFRGKRNRRRGHRKQHRSSKASVSTTVNEDYSVIGNNGMNEISIEQDKCSTTNAGHVEHEQGELAEIENKDASFHEDTIQCACVNEPDKAEHSLCDSVVVPVETESSSMDNQCPNYSQILSEDRNQVNDFKNYKNGRKRRQQGDVKGPVKKRGRPKCVQDMSDDRPMFDKTDEKSIQAAPHIEKCNLDSSNYADIISKTKTLKVMLVALSQRDIATYSSRDPSSSVNSNNCVLHEQDIEEPNVTQENPSGICENSEISADVVPCEQLEDEISKDNRVDDADNSQEVLKDGNCSSKHLCQTHFISNIEASDTSCNQSKNMTIDFAETSENVDAEQHLHSDILEENEYVAVHIDEESDAYIEDREESVERNIVLNDEYINDELQSDEVDGSAVEDEIKSDAEFPKEECVEGTLPDVSQISNNVNNIRYRLQQVCGKLTSDKVDGFEIRSLVGERILTTDPNENPTDE